jgi:hypothetical protein
LADGFFSDGFVAGGSASSASMASMLGRLDCNS